MRLARRSVVLLPVALAACVRPPAPRVFVGQPYQLAGVWYYPREDFSLVQTGLAAVASDTGAGRRTANGESHDPAQLLAAHRTLQLPVVLRVTNLETGLELEVRANDRGPANPGRVVELSRRAADLLGIGGTAQVRIAVVADSSRAVTANLPDPETPRLAVATAPIGGVQREDLAPPPGAAQASRVREARALPAPAGAQAAVTATAATVPDRLPERVSRAPPQPGRLFVEAATFGRRDLAEAQAARIGGRVDAIGARGRQSFRVRIGPLATVAEADRALERTLRAGVSEARILVD